MPNPHEPALRADEILRAALDAADGNLSELARRLNYTPSSVGRWYSGATKPDPWTCLKLAQLVYRSANDVLEAFGYDPSPLRSLYVDRVPDAPLDPDAAIVEAGLPRAAPHIRLAVVTLLEPYARPKGPRRLVEDEAADPRNTRAGEAEIPGAGEAEIPPLPTTSFRLPGRLSAE